MTNNDYNILLILYKNNRTNEKEAFTIKQIQKKTNLSISTIRKSLMLLLDLKYVSKGFQHWRALSYFITENGIEYINKFKEEQK